jgi:GNAT superfamily N-acetyltransferase
LPSELVVPSGYAFERLDVSRHSRDEFSCGKPDLDTFLRTQASQAQSKYLSSTHVLLRFNELRTIVGYVTLVSSEIPLAECPSSLKRISNRSRLPALLLARMAVDSAHKGNDLGEFLLKYSLTTAWNMNIASGCLLVAVDAKDEDSKNFYLKYGFIPFPDKPLRMFLPMGTIEELMR